uniref:Glucose-methanol-choline oxidoreductase C-terminal domain-containing protein n=1 Tax=Megaselia scalaris TaxID=36166 RepID=T1GJI5_MEGSC
MGSSEDCQAVVDSRLKVHGINGMRVMDCLIMPNVIFLKGNWGGCQEETYSERLLLMKRHGCA